MKKLYAVLSGIGGYMPDYHSAENADENDPNRGWYSSRKDAEQDAARVANDYKEEGYIVKGSAREGFYSCLRREHDIYTLPVYIEIVSIDAATVDQY